MSNATTGKVLAIAILLVVLVPLAILSYWEPVKVGLPAGVFVLTGLWVLLHNRNADRRG